MIETQRDGGMAMTYTEKNNLTVIELRADEESISISEIRRTLFEHPSNMIYCETDGKLSGLISTGDIYRALENGKGEVAVNKNFSYLYCGEYMKARTIFLQKPSINALPVILEDRTLIGEYTRWDDIQWLKNTLNTGNGYHDATWFDGRKIALVQSENPVKEKLKIAEKINEQLKQRGVAVQCVDYPKAIQCLDLYDMFLFPDENELRAFIILLYIVLQKDCDKIDVLKTHKSILKADNYRKRRYNFCLDKLQNQGIGMLGLVLRESEYSQNLSTALRNKFETAGEEMWRGIIPKSTYKDFFDDLYDEEYIEQITSMETKGYENDRGILYLKECRSAFYNVINGERYTVDQPKEYEKSIYFVGPCYILGTFADDIHTIESQLQKRIGADGYQIRVVNCGCWGMDYCNILARISAIRLRKGDILVIDQPPENVAEMQYVDLNAVLEKNKVGVEWLNDFALHCNHKVYKLYADAIYESLEPVFREKADNQGQLIRLDDNYVKWIYLDQYFADFDVSGYKNIGSIVMNCNPFTYGHRFLIETALKTVDFLILFVLEEDLSLFSFTQRFGMVWDGCSDLRNVMVVPSGPFILSQMSFPEYFAKETSEDLEEHTSQDIITFAEKIAPQLGITHRFVGEEPEDGVTNQYNLTMKKILPQYGIQLIEIPRKSVRGKYISASLARKFMEENNKDKLVELLPETTRKILGIM